jgi:hypothetical protein
MVLGKCAFLALAASECAFLDLAASEKHTVFAYMQISKCNLWIQKQDIEQFRCRTLYFNCYLDRILLLSN